jgi:hypothetical protein
VTWPYVESARQHDRRSIAKPVETDNDTAPYARVGADLQAEVAYAWQVQLNKVGATDEEGLANLK